MGKFNTACIVPTFNGREDVLRLLESFSLLPFEQDIFFVDSSSSDGTDEILYSAGVDFCTIKSSEFDHGGTRQMMVDRYPDYDIYVFITQDAYLSKPDSLANMVAVFEDSTVGAVCGRQIPHLNANPLAQHARLFNYPSHSRVKSLDDARELGIKTAFISNSFAAYRRTALEEVGGFSAGTLFGEDTIVAAKMLKAGWKIAYCAEAVCYHSHNYSMKEEFKRYFDIGAFHSMESWFIDSLGKPEGEGKRFVLSELKYLARKAPWLIPAAFVRTALKLTGYKLGCQAHVMPLWMKRSLSMNRGFWKK